MLGLGVRSILSALSHPIGGPHTLLREFILSNPSRAASLTFVPPILGRDGVVVLGSQHYAKSSIHDVEVLTQTLGHAVSCVCVEMDPVDMDAFIDEVVEAKGESPVSEMHAAVSFALSHASRSYPLPVVGIDRSRATTYAAMRRIASVTSMVAGYAKSAAALLPFHLCWKLGWEQKTRPLVAKEDALRAHLEASTSPSLDQSEIDAVVDIAWEKERLLSLRSRVERAFASHPAFLSVLLHERDLVMASAAIQAARRHHRPSANHPPTHHDVVNNHHNASSEPDDGDAAAAPGFVLAVLGKGHVFGVEAWLDSFSNPLVAS